MKATELRIGSIVSINNPKHYPECKDLPMRVVLITPLPRKGQGTYVIGLESLCEKERYYQQFIKFIEPIVLAKEVLLDNGYKEEETFMYSRLSRGCLDVIFDLIDPSADYGIHIGGIQTSTKGKYLHQFQNLYFALTGEELEINLKD